MYKRQVFDGKSSNEPVIANLVMEFKAHVNILFADLKEINEKSFGHMVLQLPEDKDLSDKIIYYLKNIIKVNVEELIDYVVS